MFEEAANPTALVIGPARSDERLAAFRMVFPDDDDVRGRLKRAETLMQAGQLNPDSVRVVRDSIGLAAAMIAAPLSGAAAVVWPPRIRPSLHHPGPVVQALTADAVAWLNSQHVRLAQTLLAPEDDHLAEPLLAQGFQHTTRLVYLRHFLDLSFAQMATAERCGYQTYHEVGDQRFAEVLARTYEGTLDCPEINGVRSPAEILAGHRAAGPFDPEQWWLATRNGEPAGVALATMPEDGAWDVAYLGVVPEARRKGIGQELVRKLLFEAKAAAIPMVTLAVDARNEPARRLYHAAGFEPYDERDVYLKIWAS
ncbi:MAG: GNAT family N-acetyltransferase [Gemmataceae bacterium]